MADFTVAGLMALVDAYRHHLANRPRTIAVARDTGATYAAIREYAQGLASVAPSDPRAEWERRKAQAWASRNLRCGCDHIEYCGQCYPPAFRKGGEFYEWPAGEGSK